MKNQVFAVISIGILTSCFPATIDPKEFNLEEFPQKWQLIEMSGNIANRPPSTGSKMVWQEYYLLYSDSTFIKSRRKDNVVTEEGGSFIFEILSANKYLALFYESDNDIIGNCTSEAKEFLTLNSENKLIGTWWACDGPGLVYQRVE